MEENLDREKLEKICAFSQKELKAEDVFVFSAVLCDNEIDRDLEAFSTQSLETLKEKFLGVTGIADHSCSSKDQKARIFSCDVVSDAGRRTRFSNEPYTALKAQCYMLRTPGNEELIREIEGGIKKEISISCRVKKCICSVCSRELGKECDHIKGRTYGEKLCYGILTQPTDAYEWSFVAVPAQRGAGVVKSFSRDFKDSRSSAGVLDELEKLLEKEKNDAEDARERLLKRLSYLLPELDSSVIKTALKNLRTEELQKIENAVSKKTKPRDDAAESLDAEKKGTRAVLGTYKIR